ncbi:MAG: phage holin family protein [Halioglobus sp.]
MEVAIGLVIGILIGALISGAVLWVVSKLGLGLSVASFGSAMIAGLLIGFLSHVVGTALALEGIFGALVNLIVAAGVIFLCGKLLKGLTVDGFSGAVIAALSIAVINYIVGFAVVGIA